ncbi:hypothetical protein Aple_037910 [Acrocarpospora pleiomorpha]|uniref:UDP-N-acetylglucosamine 2-epimerase domain-containing protein n=1 Tax=Acrocarpospora pleiomorpha TaxID=90975 RepID=A0A5M3XH79_9ACTN|nr:hypothetical protein Aple_037910 [Acrocarpospora pleiomorpha]
MPSLEWSRVPVGPEARRWVTRGNCKTVLVIVHTVTSGQRLLEAVQLVQSDLRVQVLFTVAKDVFNNGVEEFVESLGGGMVLPWQQAVNERFDLAIAASLGSVHEIRAPLIVMEHGAGFNKLVPRTPGRRVVGARATYGLDPQRLLRDGAVIPDAIVLPHLTDLARLARECPQAVPSAEVIGDPIYDRLAVSLDDRALYRRALDVRPRQKLVAVSSTWGTESLFGKFELLNRLVRELPASAYKVVALLHPNIWSAHGARQVRAWLADSQRRGLQVVQPKDEWLGVLIAADWVIGDHGSATLYGAAIGRPILLARFPSEDVDPSSPSGDLAAIAPRINRYQPLATQLTRAAVALKPEDYQRIEERLTSAPGQFHRNMRRLMYRLMNLRQPASIPVATPVPMPFLTPYHGG